jgi:hypothetical protein
MDHQGGRLVDLPADECWQLLTTTEVGRIAWTTASGPMVVPVNIATDGRALYVRTAAYSAMVQKVDDERVAVQVDRIDEANHTGWSVLARGVAEVRYSDDAGPDPAPWPRGPRSATVVVTVDEITGRRLEQAAGAANG